MTSTSEKTKSTIDKACDIANEYWITPKKVLEIYNNALKKEYCQNKEFAMNLTERYIKMNYDNHKVSYNLAKRKVDGTTNK